MLLFGFRFSVWVLNKSWAGLRQSEVWWSWNCAFCETQFKLLCFRSKTDVGESWEKVFQDLWSARGLWGDKAQTGARVLESERIQVFARLRPIPEPSKSTIQNSQDKPPEEEEEPIVHLPLHQRIRLLKASSHTGLSTSEAIRLLQRQGDWWSGRTDIPTDREDGSTDESEDNAQLSGKQRFGFKIHTVLESTGQIAMTVPGVGMRDFEFNGVFGPNSSQNAIYDRVGKRLVMDVVNGWNSTLFVYGATGSGKTHTMFGANDSCAVGDDVSQSGIVPRLCNELLAAMRSREKIQSTLCVSYVEVYGDQVFDLLKGGLSVGQSRAAAQRYVLAGEAQCRVESEADMRSVLARGEESKTKAATRKNERSTRAHSILILHLKQQHPSIPDAIIESSLFLGDLGGSERTASSQVTGVQLTEANNINLGLLALKQVITALNAKQRHIPYTSDKLTMLLSQGLGGNSRTRVIVCAHPLHGAETLQSFRFGEECSLIKNDRDQRFGSAVVLSQIKEIDAMVKELEAEILAKERWETVETRRVDTNVEAGTLEETIATQFGGEVVKTSKLVGAEQERARLEQLLERRRVLLGFE